mgnify:CR=1 FL=1
MEIIQEQFAGLVITSHTLSTSTSIIKRRLFFTDTSSIDTINVRVANLKPLYWALWPR